MKRKNCLYVVEVRWPGDIVFSPITTSVKRTRDAGRQQLKEWKKTLTGAELRLSKYRPIGVGIR